MTIACSRPCRTPLRSGDDPDSRRRLHIAKPLRLASPPTESPEAASVGPVGLFRIGRLEGRIRLAKRWQDEKSDCPDCAGDLSCVDPPSCPTETTVKALAISG